MKKIFHVFILSILFISLVQGITGKPINFNEFVQVSETYDGNMTIIVERSSFSFIPLQEVIEVFTFLIIPPALIVVFLLFKKPETNESLVKPDWRKIVLFALLTVMLLSWSFQMYFQYYQTHLRQPFDSQVVQTTTMRISEFSRLTGVTYIWNLVSIVPRQLAEDPDPLPEPPINGPMPLPGIRNPIQPGILEYLGVILPGALMNYLLSGLVIGAYSRKKDSLENLKEKIV